MPNHTLRILPTRTAPGPHNMALDLLLLHHCSHQPDCWFRHYDWSVPSWSFGFRQQLWQVNELLPRATITLVRRPTGGGIVDHRNDWTYALALPRSHPLATASAIESYRAVHQALIRAFAAIGIAAKLAPPPCAGDLPRQAHHPLPPGRCFHRSECNDVICSKTMQKLAGAAQKRTRDGLLIQGSVNLHGAFDRAQLRQIVSSEFAAMADATAVECTRHPAAESAIEEQTRAFADPAWTTRR